MKKKTVTEVKMHIFLVCACKSQDFAQSHDRETVTFLTSGQPQPPSRQKNITLGDNS